MLTSRMNLNIKRNFLPFFVLFLMLFARPLRADEMLYLQQDSLDVSSSLPADTISQHAVAEAKEEKVIQLSSADIRHMQTLMDVELTYKERIQQMVEGAIAFDKRTSFNLFHYIDWSKESMKNNFLFEYLAFKPAPPSRFKFDGSLFSFQHQRFTADKKVVALDPLKDGAWNALTKARQAVFSKRPDLVVSHWDKMPDPPAMVDTVFLPLINTVDLGFELANSYVEKNYEIEAYKEEEKPWTFKGLSSLHTTETLVSNWTQGGQNSVSILSVTNFDADYQMNDLKWENDFEVKLGALFYSEEVEDESVSKIQKNADAFQINSKVGYKAFKNWYYTAALDINSQFFAGEDKSGTTISGFLSPAKIYLSAGMDYKYKKLFSVFISPLTYKNTLVVDDDETIRKKYGLDLGERSKKEVGGYVRTALKWTINPDLTWNSKIYLFSNYTEKPENVDVDFENSLDYTFSTVFSLRFFVHVKYDDNTKFDWVDKDGRERNGPRLQFKQQMSIGLFYRF